MTSREFINRFIEILETQYGKTAQSDITVAQATKVIKQILEEESQ